MNKWETLTVYDYLKEKTRDIVHCHPISGIVQLKENKTLIQILNEGWEPCSLNVDHVNAILVQYFKKKID